MVGPDKSEFERGMDDQGGERDGDEGHSGEQEERSTAETVRKLPGSKGRRGHGHDWGRRDESNLAWSCAEGCRQERQDRVLGDR